MLLYEKFADSGYHTSIATTFGIDFDVYENIALRRLKGAGCHNNLLVVDDRMLTHALDGGAALPEYAGRVYTVSGAKAAGVFHPKLFLQIGRKGGRLLIGSANMTTAGLAGNLEIVGEIRCGVEPSGEQQLIAAAWQYLQRVLDASSKSIQAQINWMYARAAWLRAAEPAVGGVNLEDDSLAALMTSGLPVGIAEQFVQIIAADVINRLIVVSPYWDMKLAAVKHLIERLSPKEVCLVVDAESDQFPGEALASLPNVKVYSRQDFHEGRFIHAKLFIAESTENAHVLFGSANCTVPALGTASSSGSNEEASLYRRLPSGMLNETLGLESLLSQSPVINATDLRLHKAEDIPLANLATKTPGVFECQYDELFWKVPENINATECNIELLDHVGREIECLLKPMKSDHDSVRRFQITETVKRPSFARLKYNDGDVSAPAIVSLLDGLRHVIREKQSKKTEILATQLAEETKEGMWLLDALSALISEETDDAAQKQPGSISHSKKSVDDQGQAHFRTLSYEQFVKGRAVRSSDSSMARNSLVGSETNLVRGCLNRLLGLQVRADHHVDLDNDDSAIDTALSLQDEATDIESLTESDYQQNNDSEAPTQEEIDKSVFQKVYASRQRTKKQITDAVAGFHEHIKILKEGDGPTTKDALRLRVLLMIIASAGWSGGTAEEGKNKRTGLQVLTVENDADSWPRLLGKAMNALFGSTSPAIQKMNIDQDHDQLPDDVVEAWATCFWAIQAAMHAPVGKKERNALTKFLQSLATKIYVGAQLYIEEMLSDEVETMIQKLSERYKDRLGINPTDIIQGHRNVARSLVSDKE